ncbi:hypothetical protein GCM10008018_08240 [Paenibacillus marchantiophytorum]|uniref:DUF4962 domain-containing protein n=1 Tax=Paenibacillus marchantiophytorum TaxID=1619310 RepID=A0ABQ2BRV4_9BACL|nr:DUF4962 domain-containing protein [Paenibacillus marchantiophytorum]GGI44667.1 hypothetical protein GCM10008018_08240 [Paenibacillus marchantiophytorum]
MRLRIKRFIAFWLSLLLLGGLYPASLPQYASAESTALQWPVFANGEHMPYRPEDSLVTSQSPPDFSWPPAPGAESYQLQVSRTSDFAVVSHEVSALATNFYNFADAFAAGSWYWRVRYFQSGTASEWTTIRRFRIEENAIPFPVPTVDTMISKVPAAHPRIWTTPDTLPQFRSYALTSGKTFYDAKYAQAVSNLNASIPAEPTTQGKSYTDDVLNNLMTAAFVYLISGEERFGQSAKAQLLNVASWNTNGTTSYVKVDQVHRAITYQSAMAYDWVYSLLSPSDKTKIQTMIVSRMTAMYDDLLVQHPITKNPYDSHGWTALGFMGIVSIALLRDIPNAEPWFKAIVPTYINLMPNWGGEDGGWSQGTGYWQWSNLTNKEFMDVLLSATGMNLYEKAFSRNEGLFPLYAFPHGSPKGIIGDGTHDAPGAPNVTTFQRLAQMFQDPRMQWGAQAVGSPSLDQLSKYFYGDNSVEARPPVDLPTSKWFKDIGLVAMHSDLLNPERISMYFKSSPYGSYIHSQADQNSFVINAYGESLAAKTGYYDDFNSAHRTNYTAQTLSSNAITIDGKKGQPINNIDADGNILGFVTHPDFDATSGDATAAYQGSLTKAVRHMIYVKPSMFVVVDQLKSANPAGSEFEWRLHAEDQLILDADQAGATILKGKAGLKTRIQYPANMRATLEDKFISMDGQEVPPKGDYANIPSQKHAAFITPKSNNSTIVATMGVYESGTAAPNVVSENLGNYMKLSFEDGSTVYVRLTESGEVDAGAIRFDGAAASVRGDSVMLVSGTRLVKDGVTLLTSDKPATIAYGKQELSISGTEETNVTIRTNGIVRVRDAQGTDIPNTGSASESMGLRGVFWQASSTALTLRVEKGSQSFKLNNAPSSEPLGNVTLQTNVNGSNQSVVLHAQSDLEGNSVAWGKLVNSEGLYEVVEAPTGFLFEHSGSQKTLYLEQDASIILHGAADHPLTLHKLGSNIPIDTQVRADYDNVRNLLSVQQEAERFDSSRGGTFTRYATREFLSNKIGVGNWITKGQWLSYSLDVPKRGNYDLVLKYVSGPAAGTARYLQIGNNIPVYFQVPPTLDFGQVEANWRSLRVKTGTMLEPGPVRLTMWNSNGLMNLDWIGLMEVKDDEVPPTIPANLRLVTTTDTTATIRWDASSDNAGIKEYRIYVNDVLQATVPGNVTEAIVPGLTSGIGYRIKMRAIDTSDNPSFDSLPLDIVTADSVAPDWSGDAALRTTLIFAETARLSWSEATDNSGQPVAYNLYLINGSAVDKIATVSGTTYDVQGLQPSSMYRFKVEAVDLRGNQSMDGPSVFVKTLAPGLSGGFYESFTNMPMGALASGNGWIVDTNHGTSVSVTSSTYASDKTVSLKDTYYDLADEYRRAPVLARNIPAMSGRVVFETKYKFNPISNPYGNYEIELHKSGAIAARLSGFSGGAFGYWVLINGALKTMSIPSNTGGFKIPVGDWIKLKVVVDTNTKAYDFEFATASLKNYTGIIDSPGTLDKTNGIYRIFGVPFYNGNTTINAIDTFNFSPTRYTGEYTLDDLALYKETVLPEAALTAPDRAGIAELVPIDFSLRNVTNIASEKVAFHYNTQLFDFVGVNSTQTGITVTNTVYDQANGTVTVNVSNSGYGSGTISGNQKLLRLMLRAKSATGIGSVEVTSAQITNSTGTVTDINGLPGRTISVHTVTDVY